MCCSFPLSISDMVTPENIGSNALLNHFGVSTSNSDDRVYQNYDSSSSYSTYDYDSSSYYSSDYNSGTGSGTYSSYSSGGSSSYSSTSGTGSSSYSSSSYSSGTSYSGSNSNSGSGSNGGDLCSAAYTTPSSSYWNSYTSIDDIINTTATEEPTTSDYTTTIEYSTTEFYASTTAAPVDISLYRIESFDDLCKYTFAI